MAVSITICNLALGELRAPPIVDIDEETLEARECARYYPQCLDLLLERMDWSFANRLASLALLTVNPRSTEWAFAYALPADIATAKRLVPPGTAITWSGYCFRHRPMDDYQPPFIIEAGVLFADLPDASLEYSSMAVTEAQMSAMFKDALSYSLASRLAVPVRDSPTLKGQLLQQAELAALRAQADDENRQRRRDQPFVDEVTAARHGYGC